MKQNEFFNILMDGLKDFPETKLQDIISYYENKFTIGSVSEIAEEDIINELGNPYLIVEKYRNEDSNTNFNSELDNSNSNSNNIITNENPNNHSNAVNTNSNDLNDIITVTEKLTEVPNKDVDNKYRNLDSDLKSTDNIYINSDDFYNLNASSNYAEKNNEPAASEKTNYSFKSENNFSSNIDNSNSSKKNSNTTTTSYNVNNVLRYCIVGLTLIIFSPVITGIIGFIFGLFGVTISILVGSIGLLVGGTFTSFVGIPNLPMFVANFPYPVIVLFSLGSISLSILLTIVFYYLCKLLIKWLISGYKLLKSKGGAF